MTLASGMNLLAGFLRMITDSSFAAEDAKLPGAGVRKLVVFEVERWSPGRFFTHGRLDMA